MPNCNWWLWLIFPSHFRISRASRSLDLEICATSELKFGCVRRFFRLFSLAAHRLHGVSSVLWTSAWGSSNQFSDRRPKCHHTLAFYSAFLTLFTKSPYSLSDLSVISCSYGLRHDSWADVFQPERWKALFSYSSSSPASLSCVPNDQPLCSCPPCSLGG